MDKHEKNLHKVIKKLKKARRHVHPCRFKEAQEEIEAVIYILEKHLKDYESINISHSFNHTNIKINNNCGCKHKQSVSLTSNRYFSKVSEGILYDSDLQIPATSFIDDNGLTIQTFPTAFQYYNLFINGMLQENGVCLIASSQITIKGGSILDKDDPISLEFISLFFD